MTDYLSKLFSLAGKVCVVTGASRGLGRTIAGGLARAGADLVLVARTPGPLEAAAAELAETGRDVLAVAADITQPAEMDGLLARIMERFGRVDCLFCNAGISPVVRRAEKVDLQTWDEIFALNVRGNFYCAQTVGRQMLQKGHGSIVFMASSAYGMTVPGLVPYCSSKAALVHMSRVLAREWAKSGVRVNALCPGTFDTDMSRDFNEKGGWFREMLLDRLPMGRFGNPEELIGIAILLASDAGSYMTGGVYHVDGGWSTD